MSFKSSLLPKAIVVSVELCWQIISHPVGGSWNILSVLTRKIILARSCLCTNFISLRSGWMSLQGPLLWAKCGWVKSDIILILAYDHLGESLSFSFSSDWSFSDGVSLRTAGEKHFPHIKTIHFHPLPFCFTFFTTDPVGLGSLSSIGCKSILFCPGLLLSCILSNVCTFCRIWIRYAKASVANSWLWWKGHGCLRFYYHVYKFSAIFCCSCKFPYYFSYYLSKKYYHMILLPLGQFHHWCLLCVLIGFLSLWVSIMRLFH